MGSVLLSHERLSDMFAMRTGLEQTAQQREMPVEVAVEVAVLGAQQDRLFAGHAPELERRAEDRRLVEIDVDYTGFTIPDQFVVGYGLDYGELYRNLRFVGVLKPEVYSEG